jgi:arginine/lysine/ornithine decarboxylase
LALHHYDPKDLSTDFQQDTSPSMPLISAADNNAKEKESKPNNHMSLQEEEMEEAVDMGLQVEFLKGEEVVEDQDVFVDKTQENGDLWKDECVNDEDFVDFDDSDDDDLL